MSGDNADGYRLSVDFIACRGHGICAYLLPRNLGLDEWGYPIVLDELLEAGQLRSAKRAALLCPEMAIKIDRVQAKAKAAHR